MEQMIIRGCFPVLSKIWQQSQNLWQNDMANVKMVYPANVIQEGDPAKAFRLEFALAGFKRDEISVDLENNVLYVKASKMTEDESQDEFVIRNGISYRDFDVSYRLMDEIDQSAIKVKFEDGLLIITLPIKKEEIPQRTKLAIE